MDCSLFKESLTPEAHGVLQYMGFKADRRGKYAGGTAPILARFDIAPSTVYEAIDLLRDAEAVSRLPGDEAIYSLDARCVCEEFHLENLTRRHTAPPGAEEVLPSGSTDQSNPSSQVPVNRSSKRVRRRGEHTFGEGRDAGWVGKEPEEWNATDLANYFSVQLVTTSRRQRKPVAGHVNVKALRGNIARWRVQGWDSPVIKAMIDSFCANPEKWCRNGTPAWRAFLANSTRLHLRVAKVLDQETMTGRGTVIHDCLGLRRMQEISAASE